MNKTYYDTEEVYWEFFQTPKMELFTKMVNGFQPLIIYAKSSISDVWQVSEHVSAINTPRFEVSIILV